MKRKCCSEFSRYASPDQKERPQGLTVCERCPETERGMKLVFGLLQRKLVALWQQSETLRNQRIVDIVENPFLETAVDGWLVKAAT